MTRISFDIPFYFLILFAALSAGLSYWMYRKVEEIIRPRKILLSVLRALSFFLILLAMTNLTTDLMSTHDKKRDVFVIVDDSKSMSIFDSSVERGQVVRNLFASKVYRNLSREFDVLPLEFGGDVLKKSNLDSMKFDQPFTNIQSALVEAARLETNTHPAFALLLTDGNYNDGGNPVDVAREFPFPLFTVGIGDSLKPNDVAASELVTAPATYAGKKSTVKAIINSSGYEGRSVNAELLEDGSGVDSKHITLSNEGNIEVSFDYTPTEVGTHILTVHVQPLKGEFNQKNNSTSASIEVLKGKYSILLIAGRPSPDVAFLRDNIEASEDFDLNVLIQKDGSSFYLPAGEGKESPRNAEEILSRDYDAILLDDFPNSLSAETLNDVQRILGSRAYVYFAGQDFSPGAVGRLPRLPFETESYPTATDAAEYQVGISTASEGESAADLQAINSLLHENSELIPPLYYQRIECKPAYAATPLAYPVLNGIKLPSPIFLVSDLGRSAAFLAYGLYRIQLMSSISGLSSDFSQDFLAALVRNLINSGKQKLLTVNTDKKTYDPSETVNFVSLLVDQTGAPINDATVDVSVKSEETKKFVNDVQLNQNGDGSYSGSVGGMGEGKYSYHAQARYPSGFLGADSGTIIVESLNKEFIQTSMNAQLLRQLSSVTGGELLTPQEFIDGKLPVKTEWKQPIILKNERKFELLSSLPILAVVFVLLGAEWLMRKLWGLL